MKSRLPILAVLAGLGSSFSSFAGAQLARSSQCEDEQLRPNLHIAEAAELRGIVLSASGTALSGVVLQVQNPHNTWVLKAVTVSDNGEFDFGQIPPGEFRLVPVRLVNGKAVRIPGVDAPRDLTCLDNKPCELRVVLPTAADDKAFENCPPR